MGQLECEFCRIVKGNADSHTVSERDLSFAFLPLNPATLGHALVVPKKHVSDIWDADDELLAGCISHVRQIAAAAWRAFQPEGLNIIQSNGTAATQSVFHLHFHVLPRWPDDKFNLVWPENPPIDTSPDVVATRLRDALRD